MRLKIKREDRLELQKFKRMLMFFGQLRTFPNDRKMELETSTFVNNIGKLLESISYIFRRVLDGEYVSREELNELIKARCRLEDKIRENAEKRAKRRVQ